MSRALRALTPAEAEQETHRIAARQAALTRFRARYRHNPESQRAMVGGLHRLATRFSQGRFDETTFPWEVLVDEDLSEMMWGAVAAKVSTATAQRDASALRVMLDCLHRVGLLNHEQHRHARGFTAKGGQARPEAGHYLSTADVAAIIRQCQSGAGTRLTRVRDTALLLTLAGSGARRDEVSQIQIEDLHLDEARVWLRNPKGGKPRSSFVHPATVSAIEAWIAVRGTDPGPLFVPLSRRRVLLEHGALSDHQIWKIVRTRAAAAGFARIAPHDLRRFFISQLLTTTDLVLVTRIVGHSRPATTARYDRRPAQMQRDAVATVELPMPAPPIATSNRDGGERA